MRCVRGLLALSALVLTACGNDGLESDPDLQPPAETDAYDPSDGQGEGGGSYSTTTGQATGGVAENTSGAEDDTGGGEDTSGGAVVCEEEDRRCPHTFELVDERYKTVELLGSFAEDGWETSVPMDFDDGVWRTSLGLPWGEDTEYRFRIDGSGDWILDPANDNTVNDNSLVQASMCEDYACEPAALVDSE